MTSTLPTTGAMAPVAPPRRKLGARISGGHLLMIVSGLAAFILIFALLGRYSVMGAKVALAKKPDLDPNDEVITTTDEHFGLLGPLHVSGARVVVVPPDPERIVAAEKRTRFSNHSWSSATAPNAIS